VKFQQIKIAYEVSVSLPLSFLLLRYEFH
jgi:hypothetical protein